MEIKSELLKPYTEQEKIDFIVQQNHRLGYIIEEQEDKLVALGYTEQEKLKQEKEHIAMLNMTGADVERGIYQAKGMDFDDIIEFVTANPPVCFDVKALKIELKANNFYRGNPYVNAVGALLGFTEEQLDKFFETKDYHYLTTCKLTINPTPANATVTIEPNPTPYGETAHYRVECEGYVTKEGNIEMIKDEVLEIVLDENTTDTTQSDVQDELDTTTSKSDETDTDILE